MKDVASLCTPGLTRQHASKQAQDAATRPNSLTVPLRLTSRGLCQQDRTVTTFPSLLVYLVPKPTPAFQHVRPTGRGTGAQRPVTAVFCSEAAAAWKAAVVEGGTIWLSVRTSCKREQPGPGQTISCTDTLVSLAALTWASS